MRSFYLTIVPWKITGIVDNFGVLACAVDNCIARMDKHKAQNEDICVSHDYMPILSQMFTHVTSVTMSF